MTSTGKHHNWTIKCPYGDCPFEGSQAEVDDHVVYVLGIGDTNHHRSITDRRER